MRFEVRINSGDRVGVQINRRTPVAPKGAGSYYAVYQGWKPKAKDAEGKPVWGKVVQPLGSDIDEAYKKYQLIAERMRQGLDPNGPAERMHIRSLNNPALAPFALTTPDVGPKWDELFAAYQKKMATDKLRGVFADSTMRRYLRSLRIFDAYLKARSVSSVGKISRPLIEDFRSYRVMEGAKRAWTVDTSILHTMFEFAIEREMISVNPVNVKKEKGRMGKASSNSTPFTKEETELLRKNAAGSNRLLLFVMLQTGLRACDAADLRWSDVADGRVIKTPKKTLRKTGAVINVPMQKDLYDLIEAARTERSPKPADHVLLNPNTKKPFTQSRLYEACLRLGRQCGVTGSNPHRFRGSFAHDCYLAGCSAEQVAAYLGDTVKTVYKHYTFFTKQLAKQADDKLLKGWSPAKSDSAAATT
jgi:integrase